MAQRPSSEPLANSTSLQSTNSMAFRATASYRPTMSMNILRRQNSNQNVSASNQSTKTQLSFFCSREVLNRPPAINAFSPQAVRRMRSNAVESAVCGYPRRMPGTDVGCAGTVGPRGGVRRERRAVCDVSGTATGCMVCDSSQVHYLLCDARGTVVLTCTLPDVVLKRAHGLICTPPDVVPTRVLPRVVLVRTLVLTCARYPPDVPRLR